MVPLNSRVGYSILNSTIVGRAMNVVSKINKTGTIIGLMLRSQKQNEDQRKENIQDLDEIMEWRLSRSRLSVEELFGRFELNSWTAIIHNLMLPLNEELYTYSMCATSIANQLRSSSWKKNLTGVTVAFPFEAL